MKMQSVRKLISSTARVLRVAAAIALVAVPGGLLHAASEGLKARMPEAVFAEAGLNRLSAAELRALEAWIARTYGPQAPQAGQAPARSAAAASAAIGAEQVTPKAVPVDESTRSRIRGAFSGWSGETRFTLENGQVWRQRIGGRYRYKADSPEIEIYKGRFGYYLRVLKTGRQVGVRRLK